MITMQHRLFYIITAPLVDWLRTQDFPMPQPPIRFYPDGSLWTDDYSVLRWSYRSVIGGRMHTEPLGVEQLIQYYLPGAYHSCRFRPLAGIIGNRETTAQYALLYPGSCDWMGEHELGVLTYPGIFQDGSQDEHDPAHVRVLIGLRRNLTKTVAEELACIIRQWFEDIGSKGVFGEAGVASLSAEMQFCGRVAGFELDARGSGQETLNTLYLAVLNWGMAQHRPLCMINFAADRSEAVFASDLSVSLK